MGRVYRRYFILSKFMENPEPPPIAPPKLEPPLVEMPPVLDISAEVVEGRTPPLHRTYVGWVLLIFVFGLIGYGTFATAKYSKKTKSENPYATQEIAIRSAMYQRSYMVAEKQWNEKTQQTVQKQLDGKFLKPLWKDAPTDPRAARLLAVAQQERDGKVIPQVFPFVLKSPIPKNKAFVEIYKAKSLTKERADALSAQMPDDEWAFKAAKIHAHELAGDNGPRLKMAPPWKFAALMVVGLLGVLAAGVGVAIWIYYFSQRGQGKLAPLGHPAEPITAPEADRFALRSALMMFAFLAISFIVGGLLSTGPRPLQIVGPLIVMVLVVVALHLLPMAGLSIPFSRVGVSTANWKRDVVWGIAGYFASVPGLIVALLVGQQLMKVFGQSTHPASEIIASSPDAPMVLALFFAAAVIAPFWEEIMFRGTLLPALSTAFKRPLWGILMSSFLFAAIHPQGVPLWLGLGFIGAMNCMLAYQTKSLIPCIVLHAMNNGIVLMVGLLIS